MGIGKQVADAYIDVHGDLSKFRKDLDSANGTMEEWATKQADKFGEAWGERTRSQLDRQWNSVIDMMHSGKKVDFNRMFEQFDSGDTEEALRKIDDMLSLLDKKGKITADQMGEVRNAIAKQMDAVKAMEKLEADQSAARDLRSRAYRDMLKDETAAKEEQTKMFRDAFAENSRYDASRKKMLTEAYAMDQRFNAGRMKMLTEAHAQNVRFNALKKKFADMMRAEESRNLAEAYAENKRFDALKRKLAEMSRAEESRMINEAIRDNDAWAKSFTGVMRAAGKLDLEKKFRDIGTAMATNDWSAISRGANNMRDLRNQTMATATEMRNLGRMTDEQFTGVQERIRTVSRDMDSYNVKFRDSNKSSNKHKQDWNLIERAMGNAVAKFKGFSGLNVVGDVFRQGAQFFQDLDRNAVKIGKMALLVGTLGSAVINMLGGIAVVGQDLAKIGQISILGPAFLTGAAIGIGVLVAAMKDMKTVLADLKPAMAALQDQISAKFWEQAAQPIRDMTNTLMPTLQAKMGETATALGGMVAQMATSLGSLNQTDIGTMFDRMNQGITNATGAVDPLIQAFQTMGMIGSQYFERFGTWITEISTQFNDFIQAAAADGRLQSWIEEAISSIKSVWSILGSLVGIFNAVGNAAEAAGVGGLYMLAVNLEKVSAIMNSPAFQGVLTQLFEGAGAAVKSVGTAIYELGPAIESFMPTLAGALGTIGETVATLIGYLGQVLANPEFQKGLTDFINGVQSGVEALGPAIGPMATSLGQIGTLLGQVAGIVGTLVAAMATQLSPILDVVTEAFGRITFAAGPEIEAIIGTIGEVLGNLVSTLLPPLESLIMTILPLIAPAFEALTPVIDAVIAALAPFIEGIGRLVEMIAPVLVPALQQISAAITPVIEVIGIIAGAILSVLVPILGVLLIGVINNVVGVFQGFSTFIMSAVDMIIGVFNGFKDIFVGIFTGDFGRVLNGLSTVFSSIWNGISGMLSGALEFLWNAVQLIFIGKLVGGIKSALTSMSGFFSSTWNSIKGFLSGSMSSIVSTIMNGLSRARGFVDDALGAMLRFFTNGFTNIVNATSRGISNVMTWVGGIPGKIGGALAGLGSLLTNAGSAIIQGLLDGLKATWNKVTEFVGGIASWIANNKGPISYDKVLLIPAGNAIMDGLGKGLMDKMGMLKSTLDTVTDTMTDTVTGAFAKNKMYLAGADAALGLADGLKSGKRAVAGALDAVMPAASTSISASLVATGTARTKNTESSAPTAAGTVIEAGAIVISTPTKNPEIVASKVIDEFANYSNL